MKQKTINIFGMTLASIFLFFAGFLFGQARSFNYNMRGSGWMLNSFNNSMMDGRFGTVMDNDYRNIMPYNMMANQGNKMMGNMGMMTGLSGLSSADPLTMDEAETAVSNYLDTVDIDNLALGEIMVFDNHAYAQVVDSENGQGVFELLVDPRSSIVFPEPGPNMMWNTQFGMMGSSMMGNYGFEPNQSINITADEAVSLAQEYLDAYLPGKTADEHADAFPGYYTLHILENGQTIGMMSVNGYTGQTFLHHWHGNLIDMRDIE